ncbi:hypothetical protein JX265_005240 [Neoarthrinium moseri]|uniref:Uncharacterized protein n=1 Tax=Neoarthrinium moseri TaxID=1658444 RepID=A0A9P9WQ04_9PEZI|nr:uncharacterized protein JN550_007689 [Neoarthrinium moseri]KAI1845378.1 hypothetical protein JX266_008473 [Neoarthrinium moseri]KAI1866301.1 hypothetical protein JN550_007689 [Neoarthrinium moseri]KAI1873618.1 hypothetical protein JX265_005240 [Neoarthrinium moseri]
MLAVGLTAALSLEAEASRPHRKVRRPKKASVGTMRTPGIPKDAPSAYKTALGKASVKLDKKNLKKLPSDLIDPDSPDAPIQTLRYLRRQVQAQDFFECRSSSPAPTSSDCNTVIDQVYASQQSLVVAGGSCLLFQFNTCWGFFCALCEQLATSTDFIGNQLGSVESLCVESGQVGTIVGEDPPQFDVGFVYRGQGLPTYDVC